MPPPLAIVAGLIAVGFVIGGFIGALSKFSIGIEAVAGMFVLALVISAIATAIKPAVGWVGFIPTGILAGLLAFTLAFIA